MPDRDPQDPRHNDPRSVEPRPVDLGLYSARGAGSRMSATEWVAIALCVVWVSAVAAYIWKAPPGVAPLGLVLTLLVVFLPLALIWVAAVTLRSVHALRHEAARLQATVEAMRAAYVAGQQGGMKPSVEKKLNEIAQATRQTETALASFTSRRDGALVVPSADRKAAMAATPALIKAYLRLGGFVGDGGWIDHAFNTTDVCLVMDTGQMSVRHRDFYHRKAGVA